MSANPQSLMTARAQLTPEDIERLTGSNAMSPNAIPLGSIAAAYRQLGRTLPGGPLSAPAPNLGGSPAPATPMDTPNVASSLGQLQPLMPGSGPTTTQFGPRPSGPTTTQFGPRPSGPVGSGPTAWQLSNWDALLNNPDMDLLAGSGIDRNALANLMATSGRDPNAFPGAGRSMLSPGSGPWQGAVQSARAALGMEQLPASEILALVQQRRAPAQPNTVGGPNAATPGPRPGTSPLTGLGMGTRGAPAAGGAPSGVSGRAGAGVVPALGSPDGGGGQGGLRSLLAQFGGGPMSRFGSTFMGASPFPFAGLLRGGGFGMGNPFASMLGSGLFGMPGGFGMGAPMLGGPMGTWEEPFMPQFDPRALLAESLFGGGLNVG